MGLFIPEKYGLIIVRRDNVTWLVPRGELSYEPGQTANAFGSKQLTTRSYVPNGNSYEIFSTNGDIYSEKPAGKTGPEHTRELNELLSLLQDDREFMECKTSLESLGERERELLEKLL